MMTLIILMIALMSVAIYLMVRRVAPGQRSPERQLELTP